MKIIALSVIAILVVSSSFSASATKPEPLKCAKGSKVATAVTVTKDGARFIVEHEQKSGHGTIAMTKAEIDKLHVEAGQPFCLERVSGGI